MAESTASHSPTARAARSAPAELIEGDGASSPAIARRLAEDIRRTGSPLVLIDGPSGSGKSTFADRLVTALDTIAARHGSEPTRLVRMDELYPGWGGLERSTALVRDGLLVPFGRGLPGRYRRWNWASSTTGEVVDVPPLGTLVVEGCGTLATRTVDRTARLWVEADDEERHRRAIQRDGASFAAHWDEWDEQFRRYEALNRPRESARWILRTSTSPRAPR